MADATQQLLQQLVQAIQNLAPAAPAQPNLNMTSPYEGDAFDLTSRTGENLFHRATEALPCKFTGKVEDLHSFISALQNRAQTCYWSHGNHSITTISVNNVDHNLFDDYARFQLTDVEAARTTRDNGNDVRARQNAKMMYECIMNSLSAEAYSNLATKEDTDFHEDGPTLFYTLVTDIFKTTFSNAQATRDILSNFHPKQFKYDVPSVNGFLRSAIKSLRATSTSTSQVRNDEILYFQFKIYKKIKSPTEWFSKILFLENSVTATTTPDTIYTEVENHYDTLKNQGLWRPSDQSPEEQAVALFAAAKQNKTQNPKNTDKPKGKNAKRKSDSNSDTRFPPFAKKSGKLGDTKKWQGETYYYCPAKHRNSQWHKHPVPDCNVFKKEKNKGTSSTNSSSSDNNKNHDDKVTVDKEKLKHGMAALFPNMDAEDITSGLLAVLQE